MAQQAAPNLGQTAATVTRPTTTDKLPPRPAFPNSLVNRPKKNPPDLSHLPKRVVTVDMDGTLFDAWACCGVSGNFRSSPSCRHVRHDTWDQIRQVCKRYDAVPVVLSWRAGLVEVTKQWLDEIGFDYHAVFIPGSNDDVAGVGGTIDIFQRAKARFGGSQAVFKAATVANLGAYYGIEVVAAFDDNTHVINALTELGVKDARKVNYLVEVSDAEWRRGRLFTETEKAEHAKRGERYSSALDDWDHYNDTRLFDLTGIETKHQRLRFDDPVRYQLDGETKTGRFIYSTNGTARVRPDRTTNRGTPSRRKYAEDRVPLASIEVRHREHGRWVSYMSVCPREVVDRVLDTMDETSGWDDEVTFDDLPIHEGDIVRSLDGEWTGEAEITSIDIGFLRVMTVAGIVHTIDDPASIMFTDESGDWVSIADL